jgi:hypothetical protein
MKSIEMIKVGLVLTVMLSAGVVFAQPGSGGGQGVNPPPTGPSGGTGGSGPHTGAGAPIDGGAGIFLAAVAGYAHRRLKARKKASTQQDACHHES